MAIELVPQANEENAGTYAGWIAACFMIGRSMTSYGWGQFSDRYGRRTTLLLSLALSGVSTSLFGLSNNFFVALFWRFLLGLSNGLISTAKVVVSELAADDKQLEAKMMNIVMSMWGGAFLIAPAISGAVAEPLKQYPHFRTWLEERGDATPLARFLATFPFFPPNLVGLLICLLGMICVHCFIVETLPQRKCRAAHHIPKDMLLIFRQASGRVLSTIFEDERENEDDETTPLNSARTDQRKQKYNTDGETNDDTASDDEECHCLPETIGEEGDQVVDLIQQDVEDAIRASQLFSNGISSAITTQRARQSVVTSVTKKCMCAPGRAVCCKGTIGVASYNRIRKEQQRRKSSMISVGSDSSTMSRRLSLPPATMSSLWAISRARQLMMVHWFGCFIMVALDEAFPLFCISLSGGLGLMENSIGQILSVSGVLFLIIQLLVYAPLVDRLGLFGSMTLACAVMPPLALLLPVSVLLNRGSDAGELSTAAFVLLVIDMALARSADSTFFTGISTSIECFTDLSVSGIFPSQNRFSMPHVSTVLLS